MSVATQSIRRKKAAAWVFGILIVGLAVVIGAGIGAVPIAPIPILKILLNHTGLISFQPDWPASAETILLSIRLPRVVGGLLVGAALATAGVLLQGLLRNPLCDPYITGTSAGAGLGAALGMLIPIGFSVSFVGFGMVNIFAFAGALVTVLFVYQVARVGSKTPVVTMLLAGFAVSSMLGAIMSFLMATTTKMQQIMYYLMGGIALQSWDQLIIVAPLAVLSISAAHALAFRLNAFALGEEMAAHLGVSVEREKLIFLVLASLLTAIAVSIAGLIGFVGLVVPHAVRLIFGPDNRSMVPASALMGGAFLVLADTAARTIMAPTEVPVGILTAMVGGPFFIYLLRRNKKEYGF